MLDPFILDAIADSNVGFVLSYRDKLPDRIINIARDYVTALYQEAARLNDQYDDILGTTKNATDLRNADSTCGSPRSSRDIYILPFL